MARLCGIEGCERPHQALDLCQMHYKRVKLYGDPGPVGRIRPEVRGVCSVAGCEAPHSSHGMCDTHRSRVQRYGRTGLQWKSDEERFWSKIDKNGPGGCWLWNVRPMATGYGTMMVGGRGGKSILAHRYAWELLRGPIPEGLHIDHLCRVKLCVNPDHLEPVTNAENVRRALLCRYLGEELGMLAVAASRAGKTLTLNDILAAAAHPVTDISSAAEVI